MFRRKKEPPITEEDVDAIIRKLMAMDVKLDRILERLEGYGEERD